MPQSVPSWPGRMAVAVLACGFLTGCDGRSAEGAHAPHPGAFAEGTLEEEWSVGGAEDRGGVVLSGVLTGVIHDNGTVLILDEMGVAVHRVSSGGETLGRIDRRGSAPGELRTPRAVGVGPDGSFWVLDTGSQRVTWYDGDGVATATWPVSPVQIDADGGSARPVAALAGGRVLAQDAPPIGRPARTIPVVTGDTLGRWTVHHAVEGRRSPESGVITSQGIPIYFPRAAALDGEPVFTVAPRGESFSIVDRSPPADGESAVIRIHRFRHDGTDGGKLAIPYTPVPVPDSVRVAMKGIVERTLEMRAQGSPNMVLPSAEAGMEAMAIPRHFPPVRAAFEDAEGYWLVREAASDYVLERYSLEGALVGRLRLATGTGGLIGARGNRLLFSRNDTHRVPLVTAYRVRWEAPGP